MNGTLLNSFYAGNTFVFYQKKTLYLHREFYHKGGKWNRQDYRRNVFRHRIAIYPINKLDCIISDGKVIPLFSTPVALRAVA